MKARSNSSTLGANGQYTEFMDVNVPPGFDGTYYIYVITDSESFHHLQAENEQYTGGYADQAASLYSHSVFEGAARNNNIGQGALSILYREPDLQITELSVSNPTPSSGQTVTVTYKVTNMGTRARRGCRCGRTASISPATRRSTYAIGRCSKSVTTTPTACWAQGRATRARSRCGCLIRSRAIFICS